MYTAATRLTHSNSLACEYLIQHTVIQEIKIICKNSVGVGLQDKKHIQEVLRDDAQYGPVPMAYNVSSSMSLPPLKQSILGYSNAVR